jgi:hypothetical protein
VVKAVRRVGDRRSEHQRQSAFICGSIPLRPLRSLAAIESYYNHTDPCHDGKELAARDRKEHKEKGFHLCVFCVLLRQ